MFAVGWRIPRNEIIVQCFLSVTRQVSSSQRAAKKCRQIVIILVGSIFFWPI